MEEIKNFSSRAHHLGTTRMSDSPVNGVVDSNCKVFGMSNLYVAGSSIFPTGGHANPTLTLIALTLRLADHLKKNDLPALKSKKQLVERKPRKVLYVKALRFLSNFTLIFSARN
jgi:choline dehydrogenase-like flavoprotein